MEIKQKSDRKQALRGGGVVKGRCLFLLLSLLTLLLLYPYLEGGPWRRAFLMLLNTVTLLAGVYAVSDVKRHVIIAVSIGIPQLVFAWSNLAAPERLFEIPAIVLVIAFYAFTLFQVLAYVLRGEEVTRDRIFGAISVYLLMGLAWGAAYGLIEKLQPGSFHIDEVHNPDGRIQPLELIYFSYVTMTTLGFGEITPVASEARSLVLLEAVSGIFYLAVLVARLVGLYRPDSTPEKP